MTEFEVLTNANTDICYEIYFYTPENTPALLRAYATYLVNSTDTHSDVQIELRANYSFGFYGYNTHAERPAAFEEFYQIPTQSTFFPPTNGTFNDVIFGVDGNETSIGSTYGGTFSHRVLDADFLLDSYQAFNDLGAQVPSNAVFTYVPQGVTPNLVEQGRSQDGGSLLNLVATPQVCSIPQLTPPRPL